MYYWDAFKTDIMHYVSYIILCYASQTSASAINVTSALSVTVCVSGYSQGLDRTCHECTAPALSQAEERGGERDRC